MSRRSAGAVAVVGLLVSAPLALAAAGDDATYALYSDYAVVEGQLGAGSWEGADPAIPLECGDPADYPGGGVTGTEGPDTLVGGRDGAQVILGLGGDDILIGTRHDDCLVGGAGRDLLLGRHGHDVMVGGDHDDALLGGLGDDQIDGGPGRDGCLGGLGQDLLTSCEFLHPGVQGADDEAVVDVAPTPDNAAQAGQAADEPATTTGPETPHTPEQPSAPPPTDSSEPPAEPPTISPDPPTQEEVGVSDPGVTTDD